MRINLSVLIVVLICFLPGLAGAQAVMDTSMNQIVGDTLPARNAPVREIPSAEQAAYDSLKGIHAPFQPNPKKSALYSAILPGAGQLYNRQYWKIPVVYAGVGATVGFIIHNSNQYRRFRKAYVSRINDPTFQDEFTLQGRTINDLQILQNAYKKDLDLTVLLGVIGYTLQVLDALTFAHLRNFDVSKNISLKMQPVSMPNGDAGLGLVMRF